MEHTIENLIKLMKKMADCAHSTADEFKDQDPEFSKAMRNTATHRDMFLWLLQDENYFKDIWNIYFVERKVKTDALH